MKTKDSVKLEPFHYVFPSIPMVALVTIVVLLPQIFMLFFTESYKSLVLIASCISASLIMEFTDSFFLRKKRGFYSLALLQGILIGMFLPESYPIATAFFIVLLTLGISKYVFGGIAGSWMNPTALTLVVAYFIGALWFPHYVIPGEYVQSQNTSLILINEGVFPIQTFDPSVTGFFNDVVFSKLNANISEGYVSLLWDSGATIPAFRFNILTLIASIILFSIKGLSWEVPVSFIFVYALLVRLFCPLFAGGPLGGGDVILALTTGGILFTAFFVLPWFGTVPRSRRGKLLYGILVGVIAFFLSGYGLSAIGAVFSVFYGNICSVFIQVFENKKTEQKLFKLQEASKLCQIQE